MTDLPNPRSSVRALPAYIPGRKAESPATAALVSNESHFDPLPSVLDAVSRAAQSLNRYPDAVARELRERLAVRRAVAGAVPVPVALSADERHDLAGIEAALTE